MKLIRTFSTVALIVAVAAMTGCATAPTGDALKTAVSGYQLPKSPDTGKAIVYVVRPDFLGNLVRFNVFVDDQNETSEVGYNRGKQYIYFNLEPGEHKIFSKAENWADLGVSAHAGEVLYVKQEPSMGLIMARNSLLLLDENQGKYFVKTSTLGTLERKEKDGVLLSEDDTSQSKAAGVPVTKGPPAALEDVSAVPYLTDKGREDYKYCLTRPLPRAFAIAPNGTHAYPWGTEPADKSMPTDPGARALKICEKAAAEPCRLYAIDGRVVWGQ